MRARFAALPSPLAIHAGDFDQAHSAAAKNHVLTHPSTPVPPAILVGERKMRFGRDVLDPWQGYLLCIPQSQA